MGAMRKSVKNKSVSIYTYTDFRLFIKDRYQFLKSNDRSMSYKRLGSSVGFTSPGFFTQIIQGKSKLPAAMVAGLCRALSLNKKEATYFELLVGYGQADTHKCKHEFFKKVINKNTEIARNIPPKWYVMFDKWYYTAIHEILFYYRFTGDYQELARKLSPSIAPSEARAAVELLEHLKLINKDAGGAYVRGGDDHLTTGFHPESVAINNYLLEMMRLAQQSIETCPADARSLSTVTVSLSEDGYHRLARELDEFRRRLMELAKEDSREDRLYQVNLQMFPLTRIQGR
jgi:uncharacterized protein (TIGR02147 family)